MPSFTLPDLTLESWQPTRDTLRAYAELLSAIRKTLAPREKHWWHVSLHATAVGLTTGPLSTGDRVVELALSPTDHCLHIATSRGAHAQIELRGQPAAEFCDATLSALARFGVKPAVDRAALGALGAQAYDKAAVARFWQVLPLVDAALKRLKSEHRGESGPVVFWPHHFDIALLQFSGRHVAGADLQDEEASDENMNFGFLPGDEGIPEPYFYATAFPVPDGITESPLPEAARWHTEGWTGAILPYAALRSQDRPWERLLEFFRAARSAGFSRMK